MIGFGVCLSTCYFLRSSYLKRISGKKLDSIQKNLEDGLVKLGHKIDLIDRQLHDMSMDIKDLNIRTNIVETRLEERNAAFLLSATVAPQAMPQASIKRGRPRKYIEE